MPRAPHLRAGAPLRPPKKIGGFVRQRTRTDVPDTSELIQALARYL